MKTLRDYKPCSCQLLLIPILFLCFGCTKPDKRSDVLSLGRLADIEPDYSGTVIPPNIAPLNFVIKNLGEEYFVQIHSKQGDPIEVCSSSGHIQIPLKPWKRLLAENIGQQLIIDIMIKNQNGQWARFDSVVNQIASEPVDGYVTYRKIGPLFNQYWKMGIFQRCIENYVEEPVFLNRLTTPDNCMNCHNFWQNGTDRWLLHTRFGPGTSMLLTMNGEVKKIDTRTEFNKSPGGYPAWHPSGELIAFSAGAPMQFFHTTGETRDELDRSLDIILYDVRTNTVTTIPEISSPDRIEVWPAWTPDGHYLYFCSAPKLETFYIKSQLGKDSLAYDRIKYDLMRISYDLVTRTWGKLETVISSAEIRLSISQPKISPDGRFLIFTASRYGSFPIFHSDADLYLLDLKSGRRERLALNSDRADGYHSWSSNSHWIVFSSKRQDTQFTQLYLSHMDSSGNSTKAFLLPQEQPDFYQKHLEVFNVPEFTKEPIRVSPRELAKAVFSNALAAKLDQKIILNKNIDKAKSAARVKTP
jgi:hypothetical protein